MFLKLTLIVLDSGENFRKDFSPKSYFAVLFFKVSAWFSNHAVFKIGLTLVELLYSLFQLCAITETLFHRTVG
jgi:hypothetical protein